MKEIFFEDISAFLYEDVHLSEEMPEKWHTTDKLQAAQSEKVKAGSWWEIPEDKNF